MSDNGNESKPEALEKRDRKPEIADVIPSIKKAMRRARIEDAERGDVLAELRGAEQTRLEMLAEALEPVFAQLPDDVDLFDAGVVPGERPRLFIDMIGFVDMGADKRTYRFVQDTRHGRVTLLETERPDRMVEAVTDYVARRLLERERALASDQTVEDAARALLARPGKDKLRTGADEPAGSTPAAGPSDGEAADATVAIAEPETKATAAGSRPASAAGVAAAAPSAHDGEAPPRRRRFAWLWDSIEFLALFIGFVVLLVGLAGAAYFLWSMGEGWWISTFFKAGAGE